MSPVALGLGCALLGASLAVVNRELMRRGADVWAVSVVSLIVGGFALVPFVDLSALRSIALDGETVVVLVVSNVLWAAMTVFDARAYAGLSASLNALLSALRLLILILIGRYVFGEVVPPLGIVGAILIVVGILIGAHGERIVRSKAARDRALAVLCGAIAITLDKYLTTIVSVELVLLGGFFLPGIFLLALNPRLVRVLAVESRRMLGLMVIGGLLSAATGWTLIEGFSRGDLWSTLALRHAEIVFTFILGALVLGERERLLGRGAAAILCAVGAACVSLVTG